jgi:hypothetical protein
MEFIFEVFFSFLFEFLLQIFGQLLIELGLRGLGESFVRGEERNPILAAIGYGLLGLILGGLSLLVFPEPFVRSERFHGINLIITPVLTGLAMSAIGRLRERQGKTTIRLDSFVYGFLFAFFMALVRFMYTT